MAATIRSLRTLAKVINTGSDIILIFVTIVIVKFISQMLSFLKVKRICQFLRHLSCGHHPTAKAGGFSNAVYYEQFI